MDDSMTKALELKKDFYERVRDMRPEICTQWLSFLCCLKGIDERFFFALLMEDLRKQIEASNLSDASSTPLGMYWVSRKLKYVITEVDQAIDDLELQRGDKVVLDFSHGDRLVTFCGTANKQMNVTATNVPVSKLSKMISLQQGNFCSGSFRFDQGDTFSFCDPIVFDQVDKNIFRVKVEHVDTKNVGFVNANILLPILSNVDSCESSGSTEIVLGAADFDEKDDQVATDSLKDDEQAATDSLKDDEQAATDSRKDDEQAAADSRKDDEQAAADSRKDDEQAAADSRKDDEQAATDSTDNVLGTADSQDSNLSVMVLDTEGAETDAELDEDGYSSDVVEEALRSELGLELDIADGAADDTAGEAADDTAGEVAHDIVLAPPVHVLHAQSVPTDDTFFRDFQTLPKNEKVANLVYSKLISCDQKAVTSVHMSSKIDPGTAINEAFAVSKINHILAEYDCTAVLKAANPCLFHSSQSHNGSDKVKELMKELQEADVNVRCIAFTRVCGFEKKVVCACFIAGNDGTKIQNVVVGFHNHQDGVFSKIPSAMRIAVMTATSYKLAIQYNMFVSKECPLQTMSAVEFCGTIVSVNEHSSVNMNEATVDMQALASGISNAMVRARYSGDCCEGSNNDADLEKIFRALPSVRISLCEEKIIDSVKTAMTRTQKKPYVLGMPLYSSQLKARGENRTLEDLIAQAKDDEFTLTKATPLIIFHSKYGHDPVKSQQVQNAWEECKTGVSHSIQHGNAKVRYHADDAFNMGYAQEKKRMLANNVSDAWIVHPPSGMYSGPAKRREGEEDLQYFKRAAEDLAEISLLLYLEERRVTVAVSFPLAPAAAQLYGTSNCQVHLRNDTVRRLETQMRLQGSANIKSEMFFNRHYMKNVPQHFLQVKVKRVVLPSGYVTLQALETVTMESFLHEPLALPLHEDSNEDRDGDEGSNGSCDDQEARTAPLSLASLKRPAPGTADEGSNEDRLGEEDSNGSCDDQEARTAPSSLASLKRSAPGTDRPLSTPGKRARVDKPFLPLEKKAWILKGVEPFLPILSENPNIIQDQKDEINMLNKQLARQSRESQAENSLLRKGLKLLVEERAESERKRKYAYDLLEMAKEKSRIDQQQFELVHVVNTSLFEKYQEMHKNQEKLNAQVRELQEQLAQRDGDRPSKKPSVVPAET